MGEDYRLYAANVPRFLPRLTAWKKTARRFDFQLYLKNGEYMAALGVTAAALALIAIAYYQGAL
jgi:hypothetical protein